jgi:hypothetical protein
MNLASLDSDGWRTKRKPARRVAGFKTLDWSRGFARQQFQPEAPV